jgi:hypothetical protein
MKVLALLLISLNGFSQIKVDRAGDNWHKLIDSALSLIDSTSPYHSNLVKASCNHIAFFNSRYSSNAGRLGSKGTIFVAKGDLEFGVQNLALVIVHESLHLYYLMKGIKLTEADEELNCYRLELNFLERVQNPDPFLVNHVSSMVRKFWYISSKQ